MSRWLSLLCAGLLWAAPVHAHGLLIPTDQSVPPLALVNHEVKVSFVEQVATTRVTQVFRNSTSRPLEATYIFPVPKGASVNKFSMWVNGQEVKGELVEADRATQVYTDIVRRMKDPGLLEYVGSNLLRLRVFPVPANGDQKLTLSFTSVGSSESGLVEYVYPLKADAKSSKEPQKFSLEAVIKSREKVQNVYSPTHAVKVKPHGDHETHISFNSNSCAPDKDLQLFYSVGGKDVGLTALCYRPDKDKDGYFLLLVSPRAELSKAQQVPRDMVFVVDTSGSMAGEKIIQARNALKFCLNSLGKHDRFAVLNFATTVNRFADGLTEVSSNSVAKAKKWVDHLEATGGTAIHDALNAALDLKPAGSERNFTVVFFTDGQPTVGETNPENILKGVASRNNTGTRIFTFGVGDDVNAALLDRLAEQTRSVSTYVRPQEDIEVKVSGLYGKISHPVLTNLKLAAGGGSGKLGSNNGVQLSEMYPGKLPDLFHGGQLVILGRYRGRGHTALVLSGTADKVSREFVYEVNFPKETSEEKAFVENLWARRKVGYLLDQIRANGEKKELKDEVIALAKKHGITTPYTSYLVVPEPNAPVAGNAPIPDVRSPSAYDINGIGARLDGTVSNNTMINNSTSAPMINYAPMAAPGTAPASGGYYQSHGYAATPPAPRAPSVILQSTTATECTAPTAPSNVLRIFERGASVAAVQTGAQPTALPQAGKEGVDFALELDALRNGNRVAGKAPRKAAGHLCYEIGGAWVDEGCKAGMKTLVVKAQSEAYFRLMAKHPQLREVFRLGNYLVWVTPSGTALVIDPSKGKEKLSDMAIAALFVTKK
jgi:Ca-activated chloride channel family protein